LHGFSLHRGLYVHVKKAPRTLKENMVITVEPGIYIPKGSPCDSKWWDIGVRIEDDVVIGKNGCEILSVAAPRKVEEGVNMASRKRVFSDLVFPKLQ